MRPPSNTLPPIRHDWQMAILETPIEVGYFRHDGAWFALARPFDLMADGTTKKRAFAELQLIVREYVEMCITKGTVEFYFQSPKKNWDRASQHRKTYQVIMFFERKTRGQRSLAGRVSEREIGSLTRCRNRFLGASLEEAPCAV